MSYLKNIKFGSKIIPSIKILNLGSADPTKRSSINKVDKISSNTTKVEQKGLNITRTYNNITYTWSNDFSSCSARAVQGGTEAVITETVSSSVLKTIEATHTEDGSITYGVSFTKKPFEAQFKVKTLSSVGHDYNTPTYTWNEEGTICTAKRVCKDDSSFEEEVGTMTYTVEEATCTDDGRKIATATFLNTAFSNQTNDYEIIPSLGGHNWAAATYAWGDDNLSCVATRVCQTDSEHKETENGVVTPTVKVAATCEDMGTTTYTATFNNTAFATQTKDVVDIEALGHDIVNHVCTRCGYTEYVPGLFDVSGNQLIGLTAAQIEKDNVGYNIPSSWIA